MKKKKSEESEENERSSYRRLTLDAPTPHRATFLFGELSPFFLVAISHLRLVCFSSSTSILMGICKRDLRTFEGIEKHILCVSLSTFVPGSSCHRRRLAAAPMPQAFEGRTKKMEQQMISVSFFFATSSSLFHTTQTGRRALGHDRSLNAPCNGSFAIPLALQTARGSARRHLHDACRQPEF